MITPKECKDALATDSALLQNSGYSRQAHLLNIIIRLLEDDSYVLAVMFSENHNINHHTKRIRQAFEFFKEFA